MSSKLTVAQKVKIIPNTEQHTCTAPIKAVGTDRKTMTPTNTDNTSERITNMVDMVTPRRKKGERQLKLIKTIPQQRTFGCPTCRCRATQVHHYSRSMYLYCLAARKCKQSQFPLHTWVSTRHSRRMARHNTKPVSCWFRFPSGKHRSSILTVCEQRRKS